MDIKGLKYFINAAERLNFTRAAEECGITQTAMSQHINKMEEEIGFKLFARDNRNVRLTFAGRNFYRKAKAMVRSYEDAVRCGRDMAEGNEGNINVAVGSSVEGVILMPRFRELKHLYPRITFSVEIMQPELILPALKSGECDIAVGYRGEWRGEKELEQQPIASFEIGIIMRYDHPFASMQSVKPEYIPREKCTAVGTFDPKEDYVDAIQYNLARFGIVPRVVSSVRRLDDLIMNILLEENIAVMPEYVKATSGGKLTFRRLDMPLPPSVTLSACYMKNAPNPTVTAAVSALCDARVPLDY